jgi:hypothetical protein
MHSLAFGDLEGQKRTASYMQLDGRRTCIFNPPLTWNGNIGEEIP